MVAADPVELLRDLGLSAELPAPTARSLLVSADAAAILAGVARGPRPADAVQRESGLPRAQFLFARLQLEQDGLLRTLPGDLLARVHGGDRDPP